jgi:hypothetical protein
VSLLILGYQTGISVGDSLARAASNAGVATTFVDAERAFAAPKLVAAASWRLAGHRPPALGAMSRRVVAACQEVTPRWLLCTGLAPITADALVKIGTLGIKRLNFLTDDPWNPGLGSSWFFRAVREYDCVFSPRRSNLEDLRHHGCQDVSYLPFGFDPALSFHEEPAAKHEASSYTCDVVFVGGGDADRVVYATALIRAGVQVALYGGYWDRYPETRPFAHGIADMATIRKATTGARVALCLARRANRDGHVMRSLEIAAIGACMLVEDTAEHRDLFGNDAETVVYFASIPEMLDRLQWLLQHADERERLAAAVQARIVHGNHRYEDRLQTMLHHAA